MKFQTLIYLLFFFVNCKAQDSLQIVLNKHADVSSKSITLVSIINSNKEEFASINNSDPQNQYDKNSCFYIGSVSKMFTAIIILKLCEEHKINLADRLSKFELSKKINKKISLSITIKNLLQHTSGIADFTLKILDKKNPEQNLHSLPLISSNFNYSDEYILSTLMNKMDYAPSKKCVYSNSNYYILSKIIEEVTDMPFSEVLREYIITPLNLNNTYPFISRSIKRLIHSFDDYGNDMNELNFVSLNKVYQGSGNITSSLNDLNILFTSLFIDRTILKDSSLKKMLSFVNDKVDGFEVGLGILKINQLSIPYLGHQGDILYNQVDVFYNEKSKLIFSLITTEADPEIKAAIFKSVLNICKLRVIIKK